MTRARKKYTINKSFELTKKNGITNISHFFKLLEHLQSNEIIWDDFNPKKIVAILIYIIIKVIKV